MSKNADPGCYANVTLECDENDAIYVYCITDATGELVSVYANREVAYAMCPQRKPINGRLPEYDPKRVFQVVRMKLR